MSKPLPYADVLLVARIGAETRNFATDYANQTQMRGDGGILAGCLMELAKPEIEAIEHLDKTVELAVYENMLEGYLKEVKRLTVLSLRNRLGLPQEEE